MLVSRSSAIGEGFNGCSRPGNNSPTRSPERISKQAIVNSSTAARSRFSGRARPPE